MFTAVVVHLEHKEGDTEEFVEIAARIPNSHTNCHGQILSVSLHDEMMRVLKAFPHVIGDYSEFNNGKVFAVAHSNKDGELVMSFGVWFREVINPTRKRWTKLMTIPLVEAARLDVEGIMGRLGQINESGVVELMPFHD